MNFKMVMLFMILCLSICSGSAMAGGPWKGKVIDIETKQPLEGAVILAIWERVYRTPYGDNSYFYDAKEVVTDKAGEFVISSYTPINLLPIISYMRGPEFIIFKPGYGNIRMALGKYLAGETKEIKDMELSGKKYRIAAGIVELPPLKTKDERRKGQPSPVGDKKDWKKQRELIKALRQEWKYLYNEDPKDLYKIEE